MHSSSQSIKQVRNQNNHLKKKLSSAAVDTESLRIDLAASNRSIHNLQDERNQQSVAMGQLKSELDATNKKLEQRTERWMGWRDQVQETIRKMKSSNAKRIEAMKLKHSKDMVTKISRIKSEQYRKDRIHIKKIVAMENKLETQDKSHE